MSLAIKTSEPGGPEVLQVVDIEVAAPKSGEALIRQTAIGVNLIDVYHRTVTSGQYALQHPAILGVEAAGVVEELGDDVTNVQVGDRVAYWMFVGAYAEKRVIPAGRLVKIPDGLSDEIAAAALLKGATAQYLLHRIYPVKAGDSVLVHSAAGGVGQILSQWARSLGAKVIGTVGSEGKVAIARAGGCDEVLVLDGSGFSKKVKDFTGGAGVDVVFDSIGKDTFSESLDCIRPVGMMVNYGQASGPVPPLDITTLAQKGSIFLAKPTLATFTKTPTDIQALASSVFEALLAGTFKAEVKHRAKLADVADVHRDLEARRTTGSIVLTT